MCKKLIFLTCLILTLAVINPANGALVGWWKFDETSGIVAHDSSGYGNDGTFVGTPVWTAGKVNSAIECNGGDYVEVPGAADINPESITLMTWVNFNDVDPAAMQRQDYLSRGDDYAFSLHEWGARDGTPAEGKISGIVTSAGGWTVVNGNTDIEADIWYHTALTYNADTDMLILYIDGEVDGELTLTNGLEHRLGGSLTIGTYNGRDLLGRIDEVKIFDTALSEGEIKAEVAGEGFPFASNPNPADGAIYEDTWVTLSWTPGADAVSHDVYFGDNFADVNDGTGGTFRGNMGLDTTFYIVGLAGYPYPDGLVPGTTYYWRIDEVNDANPNSPWKGPIWRFTAASEGPEWVPFIAGAELGAVHDVKLKASDNTGITVDSDIPGMYVANINIEGETYQRLTIPYAGHTTEIGKPEVPVVRRYLEIPYDVNVTVEVIYSDFTILEDYHVYPAQPLVPWIPTHETPEFVIDSNSYSTNAFYPADIASADQPVVMRGHRIASLRLCPIQYNPETRQLRVYSKIEARIAYDRPAQIEGIEERLESEPFESLCEAFILNYKPPEEYLTRRYKDVGSPSVDYLIISHDDFDTQVEPLADWKEKKGLRTEIVVTNTICTNPAIDDVDEITKYIQDAYNTWNPPPTYVLLVGDAEDLPTNDKKPLNASSDLYYSTLDGTDYFPDVLIGRISVDTAGETTTIVDKILNYETNPPNNAVFYSHISFCSYFEPMSFVNDPFTPGDERTREHPGFEFLSTPRLVRPHLIGQGYTVDRIYFADASTNPTFPNPAFYADGVAIPPGIAWNGNAGVITNAFNNGRFIINHVDHGASQNDGFNFDGWDHPRFTTADIPGLANVSDTDGDGVNDEYRLPVVFSMNCQSGWFDGVFECFCEEIVREAGGGAVAAIGSTRNCSHPAHFINRGFYDAIWPTFDPTITAGAMYELGQIHAYGKVYMAGQNYTLTAEQQHFERYHLFGDPEMYIWTAQPEAMDVVFPPTIGSGGLQEFVVTVKDNVTKTPIPNAAVCLLKKDDNLQAVGYTDPSGNIIFRVTPSTAGNMDLTVTKHNYRPKEETITVTDNGATITVSPDIGPPNTSPTIAGSNFSVGETVSIDFGGSNLGAAYAAGGSFTKSFNVPTGAVVGPTNVIATGQTSNRFAVAVFNVLSAQQQPDPYIYSQWDSTTWHLAGGLKTWDNPCVKLRDQSTGNIVPSGQLKTWTTYTIEATIHNNSTTADATNTNVSFRWALWGMGQKVWTYIDPTPKVVTVPKSSSVVASTTWTPMKTGHVCIVVEVHHPWDSNLNNNMGQENTDVHPITSPAEIFIDVQNPMDTPGLVYLEVTQGTPEEQLELWETRIARPYPQVLEPNEVQTATLLVDAPDAAEIGETRTISVTGTINGQIIGGVEIQVVKVAEDLVAHYPFENDTMDSSGNGLDGMVIGDPEFVDGVEGMALDFNGDDYVDCGTNDELNNLSDAMTVSAWINIRSVTTTWMVMVNKGETAWRLGVNGDTTAIHYGFTGGDRGWQQANTATELNIGEWYHVAATYDTSVGAQVYLDGVMDASNPDPDGVATNEMPLLLGENPEATGRFFDGVLDEVKIYNRALSAEEISNLAALR